MVEGGTAGCQAVFDTLSSRDDWDSYLTRRLAVDCYCLQHPDRYCASAKSLAAHLTGLCWALEFAGDMAGLETLQRWLNGPARMEKPLVPSRRGVITVAEVADAPDAVALGEAVHRWARATWDAYEDLHDTASAWVREVVP